MIDGPRAEQLPLTPKESSDLLLACLLRIPKKNSNLQSIQDNGQINEEEESSYGDNEDPESPESAVLTVEPGQDEISPVPSTFTPLWDRRISSEYVEKLIDKMRGLIAPIDSTDSYKLDLESQVLDLCMTGIESDLGELEANNERYLFLLMCLGYDQGSKEIALFYPYCDIQLLEAIAYKLRVKQWIFTDLVYAPLYQRDKHEASKMARRIQKWRKEFTLKYGHPPLHFRI